VANTGGGGEAVEETTARLARAEGVETGCEMESVNNAGGVVAGWSGGGVEGTVNTIFNPTLPSEYIYSTDCVQQVDVAVWTSPIGSWFLKPLCSGFWPSPSFFFFFFATSEQK